eukprot:tig00020892_g14912.t1
MAGQERAPSDADTCADPCDLAARAQRPHAQESGPVSAPPLNTRHMDPAAGPPLSTPGRGRPANAFGSMRPVAIALFLVALLLRPLATSGAGPRSQGVARPGCS